MNNEYSCAKVLALLVLIQPTISSAKTITNEDICKASIGTILGRVPSLMKIDNIQENVVYLSYIRKNDGTKWSYKCKLEGDRIIWGTAAGRWKTDDVVTYDVSGNTVTITDRATSTTESHSF
ncbi:MAG: hypothetical protein ACI9SC_002034 [Gammaproteobacteria bacterium]|jgi:hypothetical protein